MLMQVAAGTAGWGPGAAQQGAPLVARRECLVRVSRAFSQLILFRSSGSAFAFFVVADPQHDRLINPDVGGICVIFFFFLTGVVISVHLPLSSVRLPHSISLCLCSQELCSLLLLSCFLLSSSP